MEIGLHIFEKSGREDRHTDRQTDAATLYIYKVGLRVYRGYWTSRRYAILQKSNSQTSHLA